MLYHRHASMCTICFHFRRFVACYAKCSFMKAKQTGWVSSYVPFPQIPWTMRIFVFILNSAIPFHVDPYFSYSENANNFICSIQKQRMKRRSVKLTRFCHHLYITIFPFFVPKSRTGENFAWRTKDIKIYLKPSSHSFNLMRICQRHQRVRSKYLSDPRWG